MENKLCFGPAGNNPINCKCGQIYSNRLLWCTLPMLFWLAGFVKLQEQAENFLMSTSWGQVNRINCIRNIAPGNICSKIFIPFVMYTNLHTSTYTKPTTQTSKTLWLVNKKIQPIKNSLLCFAFLSLAGALILANHKAVVFKNARWSLSTHGV